MESPILTMAECILLNPAVIAPATKNPKITMAIAMAILPIKS